MTTPREGSCDAFADLLGAYALDAVDEDEAALVREHLAVCPRCRQEVDQHRQTIGLLASAGGPAPDQLWERISGSIEGQRPAPVTAGATLTFVPGRKARSRWTRPLQAVALAAAAAVVALVGVQTARVSTLNHKVDQLAGAAQQSGGFQGLAAALVDPTARHYTLTSTGPAARPLGQLILLPSGACYLVGSRLPSLDSSSTYQMWSITGGRAVSVGLLGPHPATVAFNVDPTVAASAYLVTVEPAGGVVAPTSQPVARASV